MRLALVVALLAFAACSIASPVTPAPTAPEQTPAAAPTIALPAPSQATTAAPELAPIEPAPQRRVRAIAGMQFAWLEGAADLNVEASIASPEADLLRVQVEDDVREVEREFERRFQEPPVIYVFETTPGYVSGMARIFGYSDAVAGWIGENSVSFFEPRLRIIGVNWEAVGDRRPVAAIRHELTHRLTLDACAPRCDLVPAWLNEGQARLAEALVPGGDWRLMRVRYEAASMATTGTLIPLQGLVSQRAWNALTDWAGYYKYQEAARATELLREDIGGPAPMARVYERIRRGQNIAQAYGALTGRSFDAFVAGLPERMREAVPAGPGIATLATTPTGPGASFLAYGFPPSASVTVTVSGGRSSEAWTTTVSPFGAVFDTISPELPRGSYDVAISDGSASVSATVVKSTLGARRGLP